MSAPTQTNPQPQQTAVAQQPGQHLVLTDFERLLQQSAKGGIEITPWGGEDKIKLSIPIVRQYIAVPALVDRDNKKEELFPDDRQCMRFIMLCRSRKLNPFEGDAFMIPFWDSSKNRYEWSLITAHNAFLKRAELNVEFNGLKSGVIISPGFQCKPCEGSGKRFQILNGMHVPIVCDNCRGTGIVDEIEGDFLPEEIDGENQRLAGGWCRVFFKAKTIPMYKRAKLETYKKNFGVWTKDPAGMIVKVAEADALRSSFPTMLGGMFLKEEMADAINISTEVDRRPEATPFQRAMAGDKPVKRAQEVKPEPEKGPGNPQDKPKAPEATSTPPAAETPASAQAANESKAPDTASARQTTQTTAEPTPEPETTGETPPDDDNVVFETVPAPTTQEVAGFVPNPQETAELQAVRRLLHSHNKTDADLIAVLRKNKAMKDEQTKISELSSKKLENISTHWEWLMKLMAQP